MPETSVIILNWNGARLLPDCLSALAAQTYRDFDLWLVDNGSIDESSHLLADLERSTQPSWLSSPLPSLPHIIRNERNTGFAAGNNLAIRECMGECRYIVPLNNDAIAEPRWLEELLIAASQGGPRLGMVASTMLFSHLDEIVASAGISIHRDGVALDRALGMRSAGLERMGTVSVFGPSAGACIYTTAMLRDVGLFDERFFAYLEDADLAWRARGRGWKAVHNPLARVKHEYSATGGHNSPFKRALISRNRVWLLYKNMPDSLLARSAYEIARYDTLAILNAMITRDRALIRGRLEALSRLPELTGDRRKITTSVRLHPGEIYSLLAPSLSPARAIKYRKRISSLLYRDAE